MCMYHAATRKNLAAPIANKAMMIRFVCAVSMYDTAIWTVVRTTSTTAINTYWRGVGWWPYGEAGSTAADCATSSPGASSSATATAVPGVSRSVPEVSLIGVCPPGSSVLRDQVDGREDED